ncbi:alkaline phosphatase family protein [Candidatus Acetothermia bacterium]|nr:alkaline phosphatase family protein [Candidatus Acetothermia bacterium]MBI3643865.1 alkaline phosphatase family protein [Candidatus Acetothermia bacterium]
MSRRRLAVIALDGASPELIQRWGNSGELPNLSQLVQKGAFGPLTSVIPPVTGAAWGSFCTGVLPGRHGVFEWLRRGEKSYKLNLVNSSALAFPTLFEWLSQHDIRVGVMSVPLSYPIRPVNGFVVSDLLTPTGEKYTYPVSLQDEIEQELGKPYPLAPPPWPGRSRAIRWLDDLKASLQARTKAALHLASTQQWDFFMLHVMETDSVQHQMWQQIDRIPRRRYRLDLGERNPILEIYKLCDQFIGEFQRQLNDKTDLMIISDHGFGTHLHNLHLNTWLLKNGFLNLKKNFSSQLKRFLFELGLCPENLYPWEENLRLLGKVTGERAYEWLGRLALSMQNIDWSASVAYSYGNVGQIYLNRAGREPEGIVTEREAENIITRLEQRLRGWRNPANNEPVVDRIYRKREVYTSRALERAPDLVFLPKDGYSPMGLSEFLANRPITHPVAHSGWHRLDGLFIGSGEPFLSGPKQNLKLIDLFPAICQLMDAPVPDHIDGKMSVSLLKEISDASRQRNGTSPAQARETQGSLTAAEEEEIRERLKGLGYL